MSFGADPDASVMRSRKVLRTTLALAVVLAAVGLGGCRHSEPTANREATGRVLRPSIPTCAGLWNAPTNRANHQVVTTQRFTKAAINSWRIKTGEFGCGVAVVAKDGRWLLWGNTVRALKRSKKWESPVEGREWGVDTPEPLPRINATIRADGTARLR
jgi:hypothetical protein